MAFDILTQLKSEYCFLSKVETKIARLLLDDPVAFIDYTVTELAEKAGVSQGSITNFADKFCGGGFAKLKLEVAAGLSAQQDIPFTSVDSAKGLKTALETKINDAMLAYRNTADLNSEETLQRVADRILHAKKIEIYGVLTSGIVAQDFAFQLIQLGISASYISDALMSAVSASMLDCDSLIIAISTSGRTKEVLDTVEIAKQNNVPVVCLTTSRFSSLAKLADDVLLAAIAQPSVSDCAREARASQLLLIDTLCAYLRSALDSGGKTRYYKLQEIMNSHSVND